MRTSLLHSARGGVQRTLSTVSRPYYVPYSLSLVQRAFLVPYFGLGAIADPRRGDLVAGLGDATSEPQLQRIKSLIMATSAGRKLMIEKPLITETGLNLKAETYPEDSLGRKYAEFMKDHDFSADGRAQVRFITCPETAYIMCRYRQVHDFWHVLCDLPPTVLGEVALKWFELKLTGLPICFFSGILGPLKLNSKERKFLISSYLPWVQSLKIQSERLLTFRYEDNLHRSAADIREELGITKAPPLNF